MSEEIESEKERSKAVMSRFEEDIRVKHEQALDEVNNTPSSLPPSIYPFNTL